ncbi:hypothetical protein IRZ71_23960 [Flavobacterium sp. ANB]|uniref:hypothetical protein n=1 Tax=unclassified Flavobacterium TaxID=196869 RepID=UPI0012B85BCA|nr:MULTISPECIES: hypothetical protein [unclassified Flavobacterium]MBF4519410.1 hypothetical protein [Flavobacterium sp. ANB]MTD72425.1 hypothetical protein [Flavobacterium sp. LC2016-13]
MRSEIVYVETKTGVNHDEKAWIGKCFFSKTGQTIYFNGNIYKKGKGISSNYFDLETGISCWISGVKKNGNDRHKFGKGIIDIDVSIIEEYLNIIGEKELQKNKFKITELNNIPAKEKATEILNEKYEETFNDSIKLKKINNLTDNELTDLIEYYRGMDFTEMYKKNRKSYIEHFEELKSELEKRKLI